MRLYLAGCDLGNLANGNVADTMGAGSCDFDRFRPAPPAPFGVGCGPSLAKTGECHAWQPISARGRFIRDLKQLDVPPFFTTP